VASEYNKFLQPPAMNNITMASQMLWLAFGIGEILPIFIFKMGM